MNRTSGERNDIYQSSHPRADISLLEKQVVTCCTRFGVFILSIVIFLTVVSQFLENNMTKDGDLRKNCDHEPGFQLFCQDKEFSSPAMSSSIRRLLSAGGKDDIIEDSASLKKARSDPIVSHGGQERTSSDAAFRRASSGLMSRQQSQLDRAETAIMRSRQTMQSAFTGDQESFQPVGVSPQRHNTMGSETGVSNPSFERPVTGGVKPKEIKTQQDNAQKVNPLYWLIGSCS